MTTFTPPLAPLTTVFTPPCPTTWLLTTTKVPSQFPPFPTAAPSSCDPPSWTAYVAQRGFEYYSPAICPSGFYVGPSCIVTNPRTAQGFPAIQGGETAAYCVPSAHTCTSDTTDFRGGVWGVLRTDTANGAQVTVGPAIQIRWRDNDLDGLETDPLTGPKSTSSSVISTSTSSTSLVPLLSDLEPSPTQSSQSFASFTTFATSTTQSTSTSTQQRAPGIFTKLTSTTSTTASSTSSPSSSSAIIFTNIGLQPTPLTETLTNPASSSSAPPGENQSNGTDTSIPENPGRSSRSSPSTPSFTIIAIALIVILSAIIGVYGGYSLLQRYRRYRSGETSEFIVFPRAEDFAAFPGQVAGWVRRVGFDGLRKRISRYGSGAGVGEEKDTEEYAARRKLPDAELGTEGPVPELGDTYARGTEENPAELASPEIPAHEALEVPPVPPERWSWLSRVSRVSRMLTVRARSGGATTPGS
ncbi:hypothetical protein GGR51DRAFT_557548 [Nemania sp. FL0031]|nr:hypothetical protein GGR51DRAFT_557548 [Nemania sp. FL0031]